MYGNARPVRFIFSFLLPFYLLLLFSCSGDGKKKEKSSLNSCIAYKNQYAGYFRIYGKKDITVLINYLNATKTDSAVYVLYKADRPDFDFEAYYIKTPVKRVASLSLIFLGFMEELHVINKVVALDNADYTSNGVVRAKVKRGEIKEICKTQQLNIEETIICKPEVMFMNPGIDLKRDFDPRLLKAEIIPVVCADYLEEHPLGRAEWLKVMGLFFDLQNDAEKCAASIEENYLAVKSMMDTVKLKPTVFTELKMNDTWFVPGGKSCAAKLLEDAGGDYLWHTNKKNGSVPLSLEQVMDRALEADYWLNLQVCESKEDLEKMDKRYVLFKAFKNGNLYNNNLRQNSKGGNDYFERGLVHPDQLLTDLAVIFHPELFSGKQELNYYKRLK